jgi:hypothetical protein
MWFKRRDCVHISSPECRTNSEMGQIYGNPKYPQNVIV